MGMSSQEEDVQELLASIALFSLIIYRRLYMILFQVQLARVTLEIFPLKRLIINKESSKLHILLTIFKKNECYQGAKELCVDKNLVFHFRLHQLDKAQSRFSLAGDH